MKNIFLLFGLLICTVCIKAQSLRGTITDSATHQTIPGAVVYIPQLKFGSTSDNKGNYKLSNIPNGTYQVEVEILGYATLFKQITIKGDVTMNFAMVVSSSSTKEVIISGMRRESERMGELSEAVHPTSVITPEDMFMKNANTFAQAVSFEPGVCVLTGCSSCGFKQIQINGLGANQTTLLVDGLPLYTDVTNFYGVDALTTAGLASVDIARGPGASLLAPGALGGTMDVRFQDPTRNSTIVDASGGNDQYSHLSLVTTAVDTVRKIGILIAAHHFINGPWDANGTGMSQSPYMEDESALVRLNGFIGAKDKLGWNLQYTHSYNEIFGASTTTNFHGATLGTPDTSATQMFVGGNVNNKFIGNPIDILEWIQTKRDQISGTLTLFTSNTSSLQLRGGFVNQTQGSTYEDGQDYSNNDNTLATDLRWQTQLGANTITLGGDFNAEELRSQSYAFYTVLGITPDSYNSFYGGGYVQDAWIFGHERELDVAVRADEINDDWIDKPNSTISKFIAAPRVNFVWEFVEGLTGRLSAGEGWRSPLTFFELDHGLLNNGFDIGVTELEKGEGCGGSLTWAPGLWSFTGSVYATWLTGLEYVGTNPDTLITRPLLLSDSTQMFFLSSDFEVDRIISHWLDIGVGYAHQQIPSSFKAVELVAAQETEANGRISITTKPITFTTDVEWVASRNLLPYGYGGQYNQFVDGVASDPKLTVAPSYFVINAKLVYHVKPHWEIYTGADNLLNYTQAGTAHDEPHYFDQYGNFNTSHIWGPLRGRQMYLGTRIML